MFKIRGNFFSGPNLGPARPLPVTVFQLVHFCRNFNISSRQISTGTHANGINLIDQLEVAL